MFSRVQALVGLLGVLCVIIAVIVAAYALFISPKKLLVLSFFYLVGGLSLLALRGIAGAVRDRKKNRQSKQVKVIREISEGAAGRKDGSVLVVVLILLGVLSALILHAQRMARTNLRFQQSAVRKAQLQYAAMDVLFTSIKDLTSDDTPLLDPFGLLRTNTVKVVLPSGPDIMLKITDQNARFDLNNIRVDSTATRALPAERIIMDIMNLCGDFTPVDRVEALQDWVDDDENGYREDASYQERERPYICPNSWVQSWIELTYIDGYTRTMFDQAPSGSRRPGFNAQLSECITLLPQPRVQPMRVNVNTASRDVLTGVFGMSHLDAVEYVLGLRLRRPIRSVDELLLAFPDATVFQSVRPYLDVHSSTYSLDARAYMDGQAASVRATVDRSVEGDVRILQWVMK